MQDKIELHFDENCLGKRLDQLITSELGNDYSRARVQSFIKQGCVADINGKVITQASLKLKEPLSIILNIPETKPSEIEPEDIAIDIVYEDEDLLVINKQSGLVVHPGAGNWSGTLVNALLHHCKGKLSGIGGVERPGIVHRLDKETSGLMLVAKNDKAHKHLSEQLSNRTLKRTYWAFVWGYPMPPLGTIQTLYGRDPKSRLKMSVLQYDGKEAITSYKALEKYHNNLYSLVECQLQTGRTHQIRVHMAHLGYSLIGDPLYGQQASKTAAMIKDADLEESFAQKLLNFNRQALHAKSVEFVHPNTNKTMSFSSDLPSDFFFLTY